MFLQISSQLPDNNVKRRYEIWKGSNIFCLQGRLIFGPDVRSLVLTVFFITVPAVVFCIFVARKLIYHFPHHEGILILVVFVVFTIYDLALLLPTSGRDPGIIPRNLNPPEPENYEGMSEIGGGQTPQLRFPRTKDIMVNGIIVKVKYCDTCMLYRPPRCSHCSICNNCVEQFDHHCPWVGQCIGLRNYRFFFMFVSTTTLLCVYVFGFSWVYIRKIMDAEHTTVWKAMARTPASIVLIVYCFISMWFVGGLTAFHLYLISTNQTTYENFRYRYDRRENPYNRGILKNFIEKFFTPIPPSKNNFREVAPPATDLRARSINRGFISPNMGRTVADIETDGKPVWEDIRIAIDGFEEHLIPTNVDKDGVFCAPSPDLKRTVSANGVTHPRRSSLGRKGTSCDFSSEVLDFSNEFNQNVHRDVTERTR